MALCRRTSSLSLFLLLSAAAALAVTPAAPGALRPADSRPRLRHCGQRSDLLVLSADPIRGAVRSGAAVRSAATGALLPIWLAVFVQMVGVGINLSTLPLFVLSLGGTPLQLASVVSAFSGAQMVGGPLLVRVSGRVGRFGHTPRRL